MMQKIRFLTYVHNIILCDNVYKTITPVSKECVGLVVPSQIHQHFPLKFTIVNN